MLLDSFLSMHWTSELLVAAGSFSCLLAPKPGCRTTIFSPDPLPAFNVALADWNDIRFTVQICPSKNFIAPPSESLADGLQNFFTRCEQKHHSSNMSADDKKEETTQNPTEFFESIGNKVEGVSATTNGATAEDDQYRPVEEIESLCMNCGENVSFPPLKDFVEMLYTNKHTSRASLVSFSQQSPTSEK